MYLIKIQQYNKSNRWIQNGGELIIDSIINGNVFGVDSDGNLTTLLPDSLTEGLDFEFGTHRFYNSTAPFGFEIEARYDKLQFESTDLLRDLYDIKPEEKWSVFESSDANKLKILCSRVKFEDESPIEFIEINDAYFLFYTLIFNEYDLLTRKEKDVLYDYCTLKNNRGVFVIFKSVVNNILSEKYMKILQKCNYQEFSEMNWLYYKYTKE